MRDLEIILDNKPGTLALLGEVLGKNKISLEGGGVFQNGEKCIAHFLVEEAESAKEVLEKAGISVIKINEVIIQKLRQDVPGTIRNVLQKNGRCKRKYFSPIQRPLQPVNCCSR